MSKDRLKQIAFLQFIGPIWVILGHSANGLQEQVYNIWWIFTKEWIYFFHMPLFFFISGYLAGYKIDEYSDYKKMIINKFLKLIVPYLCWNILFIGPKILFGSFFHDQVEFSMEYMIRLLLYPRKMILGHSWFLVALFLTYCVLPVFIFCIRRKRTEIIMSLLLVILYFIPCNTMLLTANDLHKDLLFFWIGMFVGLVPTENQKRFLTKKLFMGNCVLSVILSIAALYYDNQILILLAAVAIIADLYSLPMVFGIDNKWIDYQSKLSFVIYILHWPCMMIVKLILVKLFSLNIAWILLAEVIAGYFGPCVIAKLLDCFNSLKFRSLIGRLLGV